jgi:2-polyprenyl-3-methyl-5-hydroxy-6-metoxy-1,4-benzoquinol methylase
MDHSICPVCGNPLKVKYKLKFNIYKCDNCGLFNSDAQFEHSFQSDLESVSRDIGLQQLRLKNFDIILKELLKLESNKGSKISGMEIGSGNGWWLETCKKNNIDCIGIEPERIYENYHKENKLDIIYGFYPDVSPKKEKGYDFIIFNDVFEHIEDINGLIENLKKDLSNDGILIINLPMSTGFFYKMAVRMHNIGLSGSLTRMWQFNFHSPHMNYFNEHNMKLLLSKHGFSTIEVLKLDSLDFTSVKERILADRQMNKLKALFMTTTITLIKPIIMASEPDSKAFFFKKS